LIKLHWVIFPAVAALLLNSPAGAENLESERVPAYHWTYVELDKLVTSGFLPPGLTDSRPLTRRQIATALASLSPLARSRPAAERLLREYFREMPERGASPGRNERPAFITFQHQDQKLETAPYLRFNYRTDESVTRLLRVGIRTSAVLSHGTTFYQDIYLGNSGADMPERSRRYSFLLEGNDFNWWDHRFYVTSALLGFDVSLGKDWLRWGPGSTGTLALSDNADALNYVSIERRVSRGVRILSFLSLLDFATKESLAGHRLELALGKKLTLGFTETSLHRGGVTSPLYLIGIVPYPLVEVIVNADACAEGESRPDSLQGCPSETERQLLVKNNIMWSADFQWLVRDGIRTYGELLIDDLSFSSSYKPLQIGFQAGGQFTPPVVPFRGFSCGVEYTRVFNYTYSVWYHHDYEYHDRAIGYFLGPDSEDLSASIAWDPLMDLRLSLDFERRRHGEGYIGLAWDEGRLQNPQGDFEKKNGTRFMGTVEARSEITLAAHWWLQDLGTLSLACGYYSVRNKDNRPRLDEQGLLLEARLELSL